MTMMKAFCFNQARFRRIFILFSVILGVTYIYLSTFGKMAINEAALVRIKEGVREGFTRGATGLGFHPSKGRYGNVNNQNDPIMMPKNVKPNTNTDTSTSTSANTNSTKDNEVEGEGLTDAQLKEESFNDGVALVKRMMSHAWEGYRKYAWGEDELRPVGQGAIGMLGSESLMVTIVDSLDTLMLMRMDREYLEARDLVFSHLDFDKKMNISLFEANIRLLGGLLGAFALSGDGRYVTKSFDLIQHFMVNFDKAKVFPSNRLDLSKLTSTNGKVENSDNIQGYQVILAQIGTFSLEFGYLSDILNDPSYKERATDIIERLSTMKTGLDGLYPAIISPNSKVQLDDFYSTGGQCDSFYEYLFKYWLYTGKRDRTHYKMWKGAIAGIKRHLVQRRNGRYFLIDRKGDTIMEEQGHLACFLPGTLALSAVEENNKEELELAAQLTESCYMMYHKQRIGLSPESVNINNGRPVLHKTYWSQRPEVVESIFYMWRLTKDPKYRRWGYEIALNIEKYSRIESGGYASIDNILTKPLKYNDRQESYFIAETIKYLFLLFSPDDILPLDKWVFNTEAHPFPINWSGKSYSQGIKSNPQPSPSKMTEDTKSKADENLLSNNSSANNIPHQVTGSAVVKEEEHPSVVGRAKKKFDNTTDDLTNEETLLSNKNPLNEPTTERSLVNNSKGEEEVAHPRVPHEKISTGGTVPQPPIGSFIKPRSEKGKEDTSFQKSATTILENHVVKDGATLARRSRVILESKKERQSQDSTLDDK